MKRVLGILLALGALGLISWQAFFHIDFDADPLNLLPQSFPQVGAMRAYDSAFASQNDVLIVVTQPDLQVGEAATASLVEHLRAREDLFRMLSGRPPWEEDPSQMGELLAYLWVNGPPSGVEELVARLSDEGVGRELEASLDVLENSMDVAEVTRVAHDPLRLSAVGGGGENFDLDEATRLSFVSPDGELHLILAEPAADLEDGGEVTVWREAVEASVASWREAHPELAEGTDIQLTGRKIYMTEVTAALRRDLGISVVITLAFVMVLFGVIYRRILPLLLLLAALYVTFVITLLVGELIFGSLSAMSVGFAAILMGLAVDYGLVIYQESTCRQEDPRRLRAIFGRSIGWAALTTACVFLALNRSIMPGAAQLGTMVAIGIVVGALMMIYPYAWGLGYFSCYGGREGRKGMTEGRRARRIPSDRAAGVVTLLLLGTVAAVLGIWGFPRLNADAEKLRPRQRQPAIELYRSVMERLGGDRRTLTVLASAGEEGELREIFSAGENILREEPTVDSVMLPGRLWPHPEWQKKNREIILQVVARQETILAMADAQGFTDDSLQLTRRALEAWRRFTEMETPFVVRDTASRWLMDRLMQREDDRSLAIGFIRLVEDRFTLPLDTVRQLNEIGLRPVGWEFLSPEIVTILRHDIREVVIPTTVILLVLLVVVFRSLKGVGISVALLGFSTLALMAVMRLMGSDWNIVNIAAAPLLLGLGLDYSIHVILALRRTGGDVSEIRANIGRALLLCGSTTAVGFGSLRWAHHGGLPILGELCAIGILITMLTAVILVPHWWRLAHRKELKS